ncbi:MAG: UDP-N-acetylmuramoylalanyl-D-glutamyl-2,6-diaminopimelate--D-alanyl-D-alanine ligase [Alphaproteobacteria bacterium]|nr:UDP-N-acetylmuramoylalanyl-D-glutamyl-2,6-diaminopimelate--D-alanyl-D-alanine ligase [Alphaproteobacteria bacterium]
MSALWTAAEAAGATGGMNTADWTTQGVSIDSRSLLPGDLFVALKGPKFDGHEFVLAAFDKGAAAAMVSRQMPDAAMPLLMVADTQTGLEDLGRAARARTAAKIIGVTGSVGKTGTKEALRHALERQGPTHASTGSLNNQWGVPLSLARMPRETAYGVFEMGMNHPGEIDALTRLVRPDVAVITTVEPAHLGFFPSVEAIADAKAEIFNGMEPRGCAVLNRDNPHFDRLAERATAAGVGRIVDFGAQAAAAVHLIDCHLHASASAVTASVQGEIVDYCLALPGRHWVMNSLAVLAAVKAAGGDVGTAAAAMATLEPMAGRGLRRKIAAASGDALLIDESYNASPASMRAAIAVLGAAQPERGGRRIAVLGDMLELGADAANLHAELAGPLHDAGVDLVFTVGASMWALHEALPTRRRGGHAATATEIAETVASRLRRGDVVMVKGSYGSRMRDVIARLSTAAEPARH